MHIQLVGFIIIAISAFPAAVGVNIGDIASFGGGVCGLVWIYLLPITVHFWSLKYKAESYATPPLPPDDTPHTRQCVASLVPQYPPAPPYRITVMDIIGKSAILLYGLTTVCFAHMPPAAILALHPPPVLSLPCFHTGLLALQDYAPIK